MHIPPTECSDRESAAPTNRGAFTLIELLVVMAIMGVVLGMTMAIGPGVLRSSAMNSALSQVASAVSLARSEAVRARKPTLFVLAPISPLDERSHTAYAIIQGDSINGTNFTYITRWQKLPSGVLFTNSADNIFSTTISLPYPTKTNTNNLTALPAIKFAPGGGLDEDTHATAARITLRSGVRSSATNDPDWVGASVETNEVVVQRLSGKVTVERSGELK